MVFLRHSLRTARLLLAAALLPLIAVADTKESVGYIRLMLEHPDLPTGSTLTVMQAEYPTNGLWAAEQEGQVAHCTITYPYSASRPTSFSSHAKSVSKYLVGATSSMMPGVPSLVSMSSDSYLYQSLHLVESRAPEVPTWEIENHSWGANGSIYAAGALQRIDWRVDRYGLIIVTASGNGLIPVLQMVASGYNTIATGLTNGNHSRGTTTVDGVGRIKPDLVAPENYTSNSTPVIASCAGILLDQAKLDASLSEARDPRVIKALLMAGSTKEEISSWSNSPTQPLDLIYGAGQVNIYNSYHMLIGGRQSAGLAWRAVSGWDKATSGSGRTYFEVPVGKTLKFSAILTWHRVVTPENNWAGISSSLPDLNLRLSNAGSAFEVYGTIAESRSSIDNVEHLYVTNLAAGRYAIEITGPSGVPYGIAWRGELSTDPLYELPSISMQPASQIVKDGATVSLVAGVNASGGTLSFQWRKDGQAISGANEAMFTVSAFSGKDSGDYDVVISNLGGSVTSEKARLSLGDTGYSRILALSSRTQVGSGSEVSIAGLVIQGNQPRAVLLRGIGPGLSAQGVSGALESPKLTVFSGGTIQAQITGWKGTDADLIRSTSSRVGAAALNENGNDAAALLTLQPGAYTVHLGSSSNGSGVALLEVYDGDLGDGGRLACLSTRAFIGTGSHVMISGLVITGNAPKTIYLGAIGPGLASLGLDNRLARPVLKVFSGSQVIAENTGWTSGTNHAAVAAAAQAASATPLSNDRADSALLLTLQPGIYTIHVSGADTSTGLALTEVYER